MADYGTDFAGITDIDPALTVVSGAQGLAEQILRRLTSQRGSMMADPIYGYDLRALVGSSASVTEVERGIAEQLDEEEGVEDYRIDIAFDHITETLTVDIYVVASEGPFALTETIGGLTASIILGSSLPEAA